jgi:hypothetical protein
MHSGNLGLESTRERQLGFHWNRRGFGQDADRDDKHVKRARSIVNEDFSDETSLGVLRLREHPLFQADFRLGEFLAILREISG